MSSVTLVSVRPTLPISEQGLGWRASNREAIASESLSEASLGLHTVTVYTALRYPYTVPSKVKKIELTVRLTVR